MAVWDQGGRNRGDSVCSSSRNRRLEVFLGRIRGVGRPRPRASVGARCGAYSLVYQGVSSSDDNRDPVVTVRMPEELLEDLERLRPLLKQLPEYRAVKLTRSTLVRLAVAHGLERLRAVLKERVDDQMQVDLLEPKQHTLLGD